MSLPWFRWFPEKYLADTRHLSWMEDCAYRRLIDLYMTKGQPIRAERDYIMRWTQAITPDQQQAIDNVLSEYFVCKPDGWHNERCDRELQDNARLRNERSKAAKKRWEKKETDQQANAIALQLQCKSNATNTNTNTNNLGSFINTQNPSGFSYLKTTLSDSPEGKHSPTKTETGESDDASLNERLTSESDFCLMPADQQDSKRNKVRETKEQQLESDARLTLKRLNKWREVEFEKVNQDCRPLKPTVNNLKPIKARLREGHTVEELRLVIAWKFSEWLNDERMRRYLRPSTLFGNKFGEYLGEVPSDVSNDK